MYRLPHSQALPLALTPRPVELTLNWQDAGHSGQSANFTFYDDTSFRVQRVHPLGGPSSGGSLLYVYLYDDRMLLDLGGLRCKFTGPSAGTTSSTGLKNETSIVVEAALSNCKGKRGCGAGWAAMTCTLPEWHAWVPGQAHTPVQVEVSVNGQQYSRGELLYDEQYFAPVMFTLYDPTETRIDSFFPHAGPLGGGTWITIRGGGFGRFGDLRCQFGLRNVEVNASALSASQVRCLSPSHWTIELARTTSAPMEMATETLELTLNGQQYLPIRHVNNQLDSKAHPEHLFTYFALDHSQGLNVASIRPTGGPPSGGTRVSISGSGFLKAIQPQPECRFGVAGVVPATIVNVATLVCDAPPLFANESSDSGRRLDNKTIALAVEVGMNGQVHAFTRQGAATFVYHSPPRIISIFPPGGDSKGGTRLTLTGEGFSEKNHGKGLACIFGGVAKPGPDFRVDRAASVPATLSDANENSGFGTTIYCHSPPLDDLGDSCARTTVAVRVTNNGGNAISAEASGGFVYYGAG
jgi:hypothetical protein